MRVRTCSPRTWRSFSATRSGAAVGLVGGAERSPSVPRSRLASSQSSVWPASLISGFAVQVVGVDAVRHRRRWPTARRLGGVAAQRSRALGATAPLVARRSIRGWSGCSRTASSTRPSRCRARSRSSWWLSSAPSAPTAFGVGVAVLLAYAAGMGLGADRAGGCSGLGPRRCRDSAVARVLPWLNRISGVLLVVAGAYVTWYGYVEIRVLSGDLIARAPSTRWPGGAARSRPSSKLIAGCWPWLPRCWCSQGRSGGSGGVGPSLTT